jgi:hypothetical protein
LPAARRDTSGIFDLLSLPINDGTDAYDITKDDNQKYLGRFATRPLGTNAALSERYVLLDTLEEGDSLMV